MSDERLRQRFRRLRREEAEQTPDFRETLAAARRSAALESEGRRSRPWLPVAAGAAVAVVVLLSWPETAPPPSSLRALEEGRWRMPTDALLEGLPGADLLIETPSFGDPAPMPAPTGSSRAPERIYA